MNKLELLQRVPTFARLTNDQLALLARSVGTQIFERDEMIFHQGSIGSTLYIIVHGQVRIFTTSEAGQELTVTIFRDSDFFGEMALLDGQPRAAGAEAMCRTITLTLHRRAACQPLGLAAGGTPAVRSGHPLRDRRRRRHPN
jgi:CRP-like cAMP-binding protein